MDKAKDTRGAQSNTMHNSVAESCLRMVKVLLCLLWVVAIDGGQVLWVEARETNFPIGEMVSRGEVRFEARENSWKDVEPFQFPVFRGSRIKTDLGVSTITLADLTRVELGKKSLASFGDEGQLTLNQGQMNIRFPGSSQRRVKVGRLSIGPTTTEQSLRNRALIPVASQEAIGSVSIHSNGALTVKSLRGNLLILDQDEVLLAHISQSQTVTLPSAVISGKERFVISQVGDIEECDEPKEIESFREWEGIGAWAAIFLNAGFLGTILTQSFDGHPDADPVCK